MIKLKITQRTEKAPYDQEIILTYNELGNSVQLMIESILKHADGETRIQVSQEDPDGAD